MRILKHQLERRLGQQTKLLYEDHEIIKIAGQDGYVTLWTLEEQSHEMKTVTFELYYTGDHVREIEYKEYLDTVFLHNNSLVVHVFRITDKRGLE